MKLANALEGGLTGVATLTLLQEALHKMDTKAPRPFMNQSSVMKEIRKNSGKKDSHHGRLYIKLAGELLSNAAYFGLAGLGNKDNVVLRGGLLGAAAGMGSAFLEEEKAAERKSEIISGIDGYTPVEHKTTKEKLLTVALYTAGGLLAGVAIKRFQEGSKKNKKDKKAKRKNKKG